MEEHRLFMPQGLKLEREYYQGFGKRELMQAVYGSIIIIAIAIFLYTVAGQMIYVVVTLLFGESTVFALVMRSAETNISAYSQILFAIRFWREQQHYTYRQLRE